MTYVHGWVGESDHLKHTHLEVASDCRICRRNSGSTSATWILPLVRSSTPQTDSSSACSTTMSAGWQRRSKSAAAPRGLSSQLGRTLAQLIKIPKVCFPPKERAYLRERESSRASPAAWCWHNEGSVPAGTPGCSNLHMEASASLTRDTVAVLRCVCVCVCATCGHENWMELRGCQLGLAQTHSECLTAV